MQQIDILVTARPDQVTRYYTELADHEELEITLVTTTTEALDALGNRDAHFDVLILDNGMEEAFDLVADLRHSYPRLLIVLVDEEADFAIPGHADDISLAPFTDDDLYRRINRLMSDRRLETLRADEMPPVRSFARRLRKAAGEIGKAQAAVSACRELGYDYVAFYRLESSDPLRITLRAQDGTDAIQAVAPQQATPDDIMGWVALTGQSRIATGQDELNHPLVRKGRLAVVACTSVGSTNRVGVLVACREQPGTISQQQVKMLELISAQLAAVISKE
jgi:hypothetical protein